MPVEKQQATLPRFLVDATAAAYWRDELMKRIEGVYLGADGSYEEGVIDAIDWLLGTGERPANWRQP